MQSEEGIIHKKKLKIKKFEEGINLINSKEVKENIAHGPMSWARMQHLQKNI